MATTKTKRTYTKKSGKIGALKNGISRLFAFGEFLAPIAPLILRFWVAVIFWKSGLTKIEDWDTTLSLFTNVHPVPFLSPEIAAYMGTISELILPILLFLGLGSRFAATGLLFMTFVVQYSFQSHEDHAVWAIMLLPIILSGAGNFSWDFFIRYHFFEKMPSHISTLSQNLALVVTVGLTIFVSHEVLTLIIGSWDTPWIGELRSIWNDIDGWLGSAFRDK